MVNVMGEDHSKTFGEIKVFEIMLYNPIRTFKVSIIFKIFEIKLKI